MNKIQAQESADSWNESVEHDAKQLALSAIIGAMGLGLAGVGIFGALSGAPVEGGAAIVIGGGLTGAAIDSARDEIRMMLEARATAARRELQAEQAEG